MARKRAPWWLFIIAASFLGAGALFFFEIAAGPFASPGFEGGFRNGGFEVFTVHAGSPEALAGLMPNDRILAVNSEAVRNVRDWEATRANTQIGNSQNWEIERNGKHLSLTVQVLPTNGSSRISALILVFLPYGLFCLASLALSLLVAFRRPADPIALLGALVVATLATTFGYPDGWAATWRHLPIALSLFLWVPEISRFVADALLLSFFLVFPRKAFSARWPWLLIWIPTLAFVPWRVEGMYEVVYKPWTKVTVPGWVFTVIAARTIAFLVASLAVLIVTSRRLQDTNERRRVRVILAGLAASTLGVVVWLVIESARSPNFWHPLMEASLNVLWIAFPAAFAFAILRHRMFDLDMMIRQGMQYAMARSVVLSLVPVMGLIFLGDILWHGNEPLMRVLAARGWVYAGLAVLALVAHSQRRQWMQALDRRFFREQYDAHRVLSKVVEEIREGGSLDLVAPRTIASIEGALHPEFVALMACAPGEKHFVSLASAPAGHAPVRLAVDSKLAMLVQVLGKPLEGATSDTGWLQRQLPAEETEFIHQSRIDLLVPIPFAADGTRGLMALGTKKSEEPYTQEDRDLLVAIASSLALVVEKPPSTTAKPSEEFEECPECGLCYEAGTGRCAVEGADLKVVHLPHAFVGRYTVQRRLGTGGMGTVYEALDEALRRSVAVKVIRDDLVGNPDAARRFQREARASAGFTHPNVVTIYDFGVVRENRAFLVMELLQGAPLREELKRQHRLPPERVLPIMRGVCAAVEAAHRRNLVHRDLKPENIFLVRGEAAETAKVLDFGIAKFLSVVSSDGPTLDMAAGTETGALIGSVRYMSPEQIRGGQVALDWDLWALAVVTHEALTGSHPFAGHSMPEIFASILSGKLVPISKYIPNAPAKWQKFFDRALAADPSARPASAQELIAALEQALT